MAGFAEPKTEEEAQRLQAFLEAGGETRLELVQSFRAPEGAEVILDAPGTLAFDTTGDEIRKVLLESGDRRVVLSLDVVGLDRTHDFDLYLLINRDLAPADVSPEEPSYLGSLAFFCEVDGPEGVLICPIDRENPLRFDLDFTAKLEKLENPSERVRITLLIVPPSDRNIEVGALSIAAAEIKVFTSTVKLAA